MNTLTTPKADAVRENAILDLQERIEEECTYRNIIKVYNEYLEDNHYGELFYWMKDFEKVCGDSFKKICPVLSWGFSVESDGFWIRGGKIHSGNIGTYYHDVVKYDMNSFAEWVYNNDYQEKLGLGED